MNPEGVPPQGGYGGYPAQPGGPVVVQSTTVTIVNDPSKDHIIWSLFNFLYFNPCCVGLAALIYSIKARDRRMVGDLEGAQHHASTAFKFNIVASTVCMVLLLATMIGLAIAR
ncbi:dispanin subfamily A member 2b-like [Halichoeres trimaculatus]|uniref:dispanin subfamily A member 2b-like n=1 Tax=Halichoeres trimaculatus TaxID=147232 RepID=UPI003D9ED4C4